MNRLLWFGCFILLVGVILLLSFDIDRPDFPDVSFEPSPPIRVLLFNKKQDITVALPRGEVSIEAEGYKRVSISPPNGKLRFEREPGRFRLSGYHFEVPRIRLIFPEGRFDIRNSRYKGNLILQAMEGGGFDIVFETELEPYVSRVVAAEMSEDWPLEALRSQAIIARSFAVSHIQRHRGRHYDLWGNSRSQAYSRQPASARVRLATLSTAGELLYQDDKVLIAYYHSTCGGHTRNSRIAGFTYTGVECHHCSDSPHYRWEAKVSPEIVQTLVAGSGPALRSIDTSREPTGHVRSLTFTDVSGTAFQVPVVQFRRSLNQTLGHEAIKSLLFNIVQGPNNWHFQGRGWGYHGMGLCQFGARSLAASGLDHGAILKRYYPLAQIQKAP